MNKGELAFWLTSVGTGCWIICFWWMHRISSRQDALLKTLHEQSKRIEDLSRVEHDLIQEVHPQVGEIKENMEEVAAAMKKNSSSPREAQVGRGSR
jgi:hypothetical protein